MYLVMEHCAGGDLAAFIKRCKRVPEATAHVLMQQLAAGLREMWAHNLVHVSLVPSVTVAIVTTAFLQLPGGVAASNAIGCMSGNVEWESVHNADHPDNF